MSAESNSEPIPMEKIVSGEMYCRPIIMDDINMHCTSFRTYGQLKTDPLLLLKVEEKYICIGGNHRLVAWKRW
jgi:hypothetical protein